MLPKTTYQIPLFITGWVLLLALCVPRVQAGSLFDDDLDRQSMITALDRSIAYWQRRPANLKVKICGQPHPRQDIISTLEALRTIFKEEQKPSIAARVRREFTICPANDGADLLITGYYQPIFEGSMRKSGPFQYPLYRTPPDLVAFEKAASHKREIGRRLSDGRIVPYWSRQEIEDGDLLAGQEIIYLRDTLEAFTLQVQGSGLIRLRDGSLRPLLFAQSNGLPYRSIGKLLVREGRIPLEEISMAKIVDYLHEHVDEQRRILHYNSRFIFFRWGSTTGDHGVLGSMGEKLTPGRSVAMDRKELPLGLAAYLVSTQPVLDQKGGVRAWQPLRRFVLHQDSGAAIKGPGRLDLFWGQGKRAGLAAGAMRQKGRLYILLKKD